MIARFDRRTALITMSMLLVGCQEGKLKLPPAENGKPELKPAPIIVENAKPPEPVPAPPPPPVISAETARAYYQQQIDIFFGGKRDDEQVRRLRLPTWASTQPTQVEQLEVVRVVPAVDSAGQPIPNVFMITCQSFGHYGVLGKPENESQTSVLVYDSQSKQWKITFKIPE